MINAGALLVQVVLLVCMVLNYFLQIGGGDGRVSRTTSLFKVSTRNMYKCGQLWSS